MPPESLTLLSQGGPFVALLGLMAWLVPLALRTHRETIAAQAASNERISSEFAEVAREFARESRLTRRTLKKIGRQVDQLTSEVHDLRGEIDTCPHHNPTHGPPTQ